MINCLVYVLVQRVRVEMRVEGNGGRWRGEGYTFLAVVLWSSGS